MAVSGINSPHNHGWGMYSLDEDVVVYYKSEKPVFEDKLADLNCSIGIMHARKSSEGLSTTFLQLHPFIDNRGKAFCHNGTIYDLIPAKISDTYSYFNLVKGFQTYENLAAILSKLANSFRFTSLNFLMVHGDKLVVYCRYSQLPDYYTLWYGDEEGFVVASEPMNEKFKPLENQTLLVVHKGSIIFETKTD